MVEFEVKGIELQAETKPDLFSPKGLDQGTKLLLESVARETYATALDWGCGWGAIALYAAKHQPSARVTALDSDIAAVSMTAGVLSPWAGAGRLLFCGSAAGWSARASSSWFSVLAVAWLFFIVRKVEK